MAKVKLPLKNGVDTAHFKNRSCPICGAKKLHEPNSFATLEVGAMTISWHGAHSDMKGVGPLPDTGGNVEAIEETNSGGYIMFCSSKCVRAFFNLCVDDLESQTEKPKGSERPGR